jgi:NADPH:quinone reductase-like Zn-dependent oxidoreductase
MAITDGRGVDLFVDPVGGEGFVSHLHLLAPVGMLVLYGLIDGWPPDAVFRAQRERMVRSPAVRMFSIHAYDDRPDVTGQDLALLMEMIGDGRITPAIFDDKSVTSKLWMPAIPERPAMRFCHDTSTPQPNGVTSPRPVTTTRLMIQPTGSAP